MDVAGEREQPGLRDHLDGLLSHSPGRRFQVQRAEYRDDKDVVLAVDRGCVGDVLSCTERQVSICAKDNGGPYDYGMVTRLVELARANAIPYAVDIYPHYSSDITVAWHAGMDARGALIGPGVHASHGMERTHFEGMKATIDLVALYLELG